MPRLLFEKLGRSVWMSHLDTMRLFQRAFKRAGLHLKHTQGFNPRPSVSIALPLSVGVESHCELLDFDLDGQAVDHEEICRRLNGVLVEGVRVRKVYDDGRKIGQLGLLDCEITLEYDAGVPEEAEDWIGALFCRESLLMVKKGKNGSTQQDIIPMIRGLGLAQVNATTLKLGARICCQNPTLNPMQLVAAIEIYLPEFKPDAARICRMELYDTEEKIFR